MCVCVCVSSHWNLLVCENDQPLDGSQSLVFNHYFITFTLIMTSNSFYIFLKCFRCEKKKDDKVTMERKENKDKAEEERYMQEERDKMALEMYEHWLVSRINRYQCCFLPLTDGLSSPACCVNSLGLFLTYRHCSEWPVWLFLFHSQQARKELEQKRLREERRIQAILQDSPPPPWSPPNKTIPFRK